MTEEGHNHSIISGTFNALIFMNFFNTDKEVNVMSGNHSIYIEAFNVAVHADGCVIKGALKTKDERYYGLMNSLLMTEVHSSATGLFDRSKKFRIY